MANSTQKKSENVQISSIKQFNDYISFDSEHCFFPYGSIWEHTPETNFSFMHSHNFIEAGILLSGAGVFNIDDKVVSVKAPAVSIIYPGQFHSAQSSPFSPSVWNFIYFDPYLAMPDIDASKIKNMRWNNLRKYDFDNIISGNEHPEIFAAIKSVIQCVGNNTPGHREFAEGCLFAALSGHCALMKKRSGNTNDHSDIFSTIEPAITFINAHFQEEITIPKLAEMCFISQSSLLRAFKKFSGLTPEAYVGKVRINNAAARLSYGNAGCANIAYDCGFSSLSTFNRQFKKAFGVSPSLWIKQQNDE